MSTTTIQDQLHPGADDATLRLPGPVADPAAAPLPPAHAPAPVPTGVARLDALLGGGYPAAAATLLCGPPFTGKQSLLALGIVAAVRAGVATTVVLSTTSGAAMSDRLRRLDPRVAHAERDGLLRYLDASPSAAHEPRRHAHIIPLRDTAELLRPMFLLPAAPAAGVPALVVFESVLALMVDAGSQEAFYVLRSVIGRTVQQGGAVLLALDTGFQPAGDVDLVKHLCAGMVELRNKDGELQFRVAGLETAFARPGWVEYEFTPDAFLVKGSFARRAIL